MSGSPRRGARAGRQWTPAERQWLVNHLGRHRLPTLAQHLGRTERAVIRYCERQRLAPTRQEWVTSGWAAELSGYTPQALTAMARAGQLVARRNATALTPRHGRGHWLFRASTLPRKPGHLAG